MPLYGNNIEEGDVEKKRLVKLRSESRVSIS